jgi:predicted nucleic-acid-binding protein
MSEKGEITLPAAARKGPGLETSSIAGIEIRDGGLMIRPLHSIPDVRGAVGEVVWVLTSSCKTPRAEIVEDLLPIVMSPIFRVRDKRRYVRAMELFRGPLNHFGDACCCAAALDETEGRLLSFDKSLSKAPRITQREEIG